MVIKLSTYTSKPRNFLSSSSLPDCHGLLMRDATLICCLLQGSLYPDNVF